MENENTYMNVKETAVFLRVSTSSIYKMTMKNTIPHYKLGNRLLFQKQDLIGFINGSRVNPDINQTVILNPFHHLKLPTAA